MANDAKLETALAERDRAREALAGTVDSLAYRLDVKARAKERAAEVTQRLQRSMPQARARAATAGRLAVPMLLGAAVVAGGWYALARGRRR